MSTAKPGYRPRSLADVQGYLEELSGVKKAIDLFEWTRSENQIQAKFKKWLGDKQKFARLAAGFRDMGGKYVSAGKDSHFRVPLTVERPEERLPVRPPERPHPPPPTARRALKVIVMQLKTLAEELEAWVE